MRTGRLLSCVVLLALPEGLAYGQPATIQVWAASPWEHVLKTTPPRTGDSVDMTAARNEYEPFRLIVTAADQPLANVTVVASPLTGPGGEIPADNIRLFREHYINISPPSYRSSAEPGSYPDALIPFVDPATGQDITGARFDAAPFNVEANSNQGVWADVYVPPGAAPGDYQGTVTVTADGGLFAQVAVTLTVSGFPLPDTIAMRSWFGLWGLAGFLGLDPQSAELDRVRDLYIDTLLAHRCISSDLGRVWPYRTSEGGIDDTYTGERLRTMVEEKHVNSLAVPFWWESPCLETCLAYLHDLNAYLGDRGWLDLALVYLKDEPNNAEDYELVRQQAALLYEQAPGIKRLCTEQTISQDPSWGDLYGSVDIWCPLWGLYDETTARQRQALGEEIWSYTALCQMDEANPFWEIDFPPIVYRAPFWTSWHCDIKGFLYWSTVYWANIADVWTAPDYNPSGLHFWGEGILLYPGADVGIDGPAPSIRLKLVREAMEDFDYMALAAKRAGKDAVAPIVDSVATSFTDWDRDPQAYFAARQELADLIESHIFPDVASDHWAFGEIGDCVDAGIVYGYRDGLYHPDDPVTRDQMAVFVSRAMAGGDENVPAGGGAATFADVPIGHWAYEYIDYAVTHGVVQGYADGLYRPERDVDRGQMAVYVARAMEWVSISDDMATAPELFPDVPAGFWAGSAIEECLANGVVEGYDDGLYRPSATVTRDQMAAYVARAFLR